MASGGRPQRRTPKSEPRQTSVSRFLNTDQDLDARSGSSSRHGDRPNNWDFFNWQPSTSHSDHGHREVKKANKERQQEKEKLQPEQRRQTDRANDPEKSESPLRREKKVRTPSTFPKTRLPNMSLSQQRAMENLRQRMTFSDGDDQQNGDGERNNERYMPPRKKDRPPNYTPQDMSVGREELPEGASGGPRRGGKAEQNINEARDQDRDGPDSNHIVGRLMQIRDYIKQADIMMQRMQHSSDPGDVYRAGQLEQVVLRLVDQEKNYVYMLERHENHTKLSSLVDSLKDQEKGYLNLLQKVLASREEDLFLRQNSQESANSKQNSESEVTSELDVQSETSEESRDELREQMLRRKDNRPIIEDRLGRHSDTEQEETILSARSNRSHEMFQLEHTLVEEENQDELMEDHGQDSISLLAEHRSQLETDLTAKNGELDALRQQHTLLKTMLQQQEELRDLQGRQAALMAIQRDTEGKLADEVASNPELRTDAAAISLSEGPASHSVAAEGGTVARAGATEGLSDELTEWMQRLDSLKAMYGLKEESADEGNIPENQSAGVDDASEASAASAAMSAEKKQLQDKLQDLQHKKQYMDNLLDELQTLRSQKNSQRDLDASSTTSSVVHMQDSLMSSLQAGRTAGDARHVLGSMESNRKQRKLQDVRERLNELKDLVQYYQVSTQFIHQEEDEDQSSLPLLSDYEDPQLMHNLRDLSKDGLADLLQRHQSKEQAVSRKVSSRSRQPPPPRPPPPSRPHQEEADSDDSETTSQMSSSLGMSDDDPEVQEKVRRLKAAKEKLRRLQELVTMVQASPDGITLPEELADLAASIGADTMSAASQNLAGGATAAISAVAASNNAEAASGLFDQSEEYYQARVKAQQGELEDLMDERRKLLTIQEEVQRLQESMPSQIQEGGSAGVHEAAAILRSISQQRLISGRQDSHHDQVDSALGTDRRTMTDGGRTKSRELEDRESKNGPETVQVTFQEPLETVVSNEELYGRMRQQRMLREELRERKRELEDFMRKDRPKRHYSRNQDNQSDNVSYSNKSDQYMASASEDVTMATWGGSTAGNLESIEENNSQQDRAMEECDDGYPSDGIVQVEEEEEAQEESDDKDTYIIDDDFTHRRRGRPIIPPMVDNGGSRGRRSRKYGGSAPFQDHNGTDGYNYNYWNPSNPQVLNNVRAVRHCRQKSSRRRNQDSATATMRDEMTALRGQVTSLTELCRQMLGDGPSGMASPGGSGLLQQYNSQLQQQQLLLSLNQCYSQLLTQHQTMADRLGQLETHVRTDSGRRDWERVNSVGGSSLSRSPQAQPPVGFEAMCPQHNESVSAQGNTSAPAAWTNDTQQNESGRGGWHRLELPTFLRNPGGYAAANGYRGEAEGVDRLVGMLNPSGPPLPGCSDPGPSFPRSNPLEANSASTRYPTSPKTDNSPRQQLPPQQPHQQPGRPSPNTNPFRLHVDLGSESQRLGNEYERCMQECTRDVPIHTIRATDRDHMEVPKLNLDGLMKGIKKAREAQSAAGNKSKANESDDVVIAHKFSSAQRAMAASGLANQQLKVSGRDYRPGLSAGISGTGYPDAASVCSAASSLPGGDTSAYQTPRSAQGTTLLHPLSSQTSTSQSGMQAARGMDLDVPADLNLFEALRETIYAEVATLISQNESRPHFLIELFRELQLLNSDYLRQRALYAIQNLVSRFLSEADIKQQEENRRNPHLVWPSNGQNGEELTPSESVLSTEDEEVKAHMCGPLPVTQAGTTDDEASSLPSPRGKSKDRFDYVENVDATSTMSTPSSVGDPHENPFNRDSLGDTVINLDKALKKMREYEQKMAEAAGQDVHGASPNFPQNLPTEPAEGATIQSDIASSSAQDQGSDGSVSDVQDTNSSMSEMTYPRIDTRQLDRQIKAIMTEIIPVLKEHVGDVCSQQLLQYIRRLVLSLTRQHDHGQEFTRFFNNQLGTILQDSLAKFEGRKMHECGEDLVVELSEMLFNELAFFRLMQDLDEPQAKVKARLAEWRQDSQTSTETPLTQEDREIGGDCVSEETYTTHSSESDSEDEEQEGDEGEEQEEQVDLINGAKSEDHGQEQLQETTMKQPPKGKQNFCNDEEEEELGKARDDAFACQMNIDEDKDEDLDSEVPLRSPMKIELAPSEIKSFTRIGSDEDDEGDDEALSAEDPSETAVFLDAEKEKTNHSTQNEAAPQTQPSTDEAEQEGSAETVEKGAGEPVVSVALADDVDENSQPQETSAVKANNEDVHPNCHGEPCEVGKENGVINGEVSGYGRVIREASTASLSSSSSSSASTEFSLHHWMFSLPPDRQHSSPESEDMEQELTVEDLPTKLFGIVKPEPLDDTANNNSALAAALESISDQELAGDPNAIKEPEKPVLYLEDSDNTVPIESEV